MLVLLLLLDEEVVVVVGLLMWSTGGVAFDEVLVELLVFDDDGD